MTANAASVQLDIGSHEGTVEKSCQGLLASAPPRHKDLFTNENKQVCHDQEQPFDGLTAELASAAYSVALRYEQPKAWLELELDLWKAVRAATREWLQSNSRTSDPFEGLHVGIAPRISAERVAS